MTRSNGLRTAENTKYVLSLRVRLRQSALPAPLLKRCHSGSAVVSPKAVMMELPAHLRWWMKMQRCSCEIMHPVGERCSEHRGDHAIRRLVAVGEGLDVDDHLFA